MIVFLPLPMFVFMVGYMGISSAVHVYTAIRNLWED